MSLSFNINILTGFIFIASTNKDLEFLTSKENMHFHKNVSIILQGIGPIQLFINEKMTHLLLVLNTSTCCR